MELAEWKDKKKVLEAKIRLKGSQIYIDDDLTREEREVQVALRNKAKEERKKGNVVWVGYRKMRIQDEWWVWNNGELSKKESQ